MNFVLQSLSYNKKLGMCIVSVLRVLEEGWAKVQKFEYLVSPFYVLSL